MKLFIEDFSLNCALGTSKLEVVENLLNYSGLNEAEPFLLVDGMTTPVMKVMNTLPTMPSNLSNYDSRNNQLLLQAYLQIESKINEVIKRYGADRVGVILGTSTSGIAEGVEAINNMQSNRVPESFNYEVQELGSPSLFLQKLIGSGPVAYTVSTACTSGARVFIEAEKMIKNNLCDAVIVGGCDSINKLTLNGFHALEAISTKRTNPMSKNRKGINIGEGAALFILSKEEGVVELLGTGESTDAYHISSPDPNGEGAKQAIKMAVHNANISYAEIDYINLHGTGTIKNDYMEAKVVHELFGDDTYCSSTKPLVGHTLGAAGAIELAFCALTLTTSKFLHLPIHYWDGEFDAELPRLKFTSSSANIKPRICMSNSYAFGGNNTSLIIGRSLNG